MIKVHMARDTRKTLKNEKYKTSLTTTIKFLTFAFCICKRIYFYRENSFRKCSLFYYISRKVFFSVAGYLKRSSI